MQGNKAPSKQPSPFHKGNKQPSRFNNVRPNPAQVSAVSPEEERIMIAAVFGKVAAWNPEKPSVVEHVLEKIPGGHFIYGWYEPIFDEVRVEPQVASALAAAGVNWRELTSILTNLVEGEDDLPVMQLGAPMDCKKELANGDIVTFAVQAQPVAVPVQALSVAVHIYLEGRHAKKQA